MKLGTHAHLRDGKRRKGEEVPAEEKLGRKIRGTKSCYFIPIFIFFQCIFMNTSSGKLHFWDPRATTSDAFSGLAVSFCSAVPREKGGGTHECERGTKGGKLEAVMFYSPVTWSTRIREVIMRPYWEKSCSSSFCVMVFGKPLTYKFASLIEAELGRA